jgi:hypothetical protein
MSVRMTVVVVQSAQRDARLTDFEHEILTHVMLENNLDAVLVAPIESMSFDDTDVLCMSKLPAGAIVLGWLTEEQFEGQLRRLGLPWTTGLQSDLGRLRYQQLLVAQPVETVLSKLRQLLQSVSTKTLQISLPTKSPVTGRPPKAETSPLIVAPKSHSGEADKWTIRPMKKQAEMSAKDNLDQLVDELESLDL